MPRSRTLTVSRLILSLSAVIFAAGLPARAGGVVSDCTETALRAALAGGGTVTFSCSGTITLTNTVVITTPTVLDGTSQQVVLSGGGAVRVLENRSATTLRNLTISNGLDYQVAGVRNTTGALTMENCTVSDNEVRSDLDHMVDGAAGVYHYGGILTLTGCSFVGNRTSGVPGPAAVSAFKSGTFFNVNTPANIAVSITNCTFAGNVSTNGYTLTFGNGQRVRMSHCTVAGNTAVSQSGLVLTAAHASVSACVFGGNQGRVVIGFADAGYNLFQDSAPTTLHATSRTGLDPLLGALDTHGGQTLCFLPQAGSPLVNRADPLGTLARDQRGVLRPQGILRDIGAVEVEATGATNLGVILFPVEAALQVMEGGHRSIALSRIGGQAREVRVRVFTQAGSALAGIDFEPIDTEVVFAPGEISQTVILRPINDAEVEPPKTLTLHLEVLTESFAPAFNPLPITIVSQDIDYRFAAPTQVLSESAGTLTLTIHRASDQAIASAVPVSHSGGTATANADFRLKNMTAQFTATQTVATVTVDLLGDSLYEETETILFALDSSGASGKVQTVSLVDDDPRLLGFAVPQLKVAEGAGSALLLVERTATSTGEVSVAYATVPGSAVAGEDYASSSGVLHFLAGQRVETLEIPLVSDAVEEGDQAFSVVLSAITGAASLVNSNLTVVIQDAIHTLNDCTQSSLEAALAQGGTVRFNCDGTVILGRTLNINQGVYLDANGHAVALEAITNIRLANVAAGSTLHLNGLIWQGGYVKPATATGLQTELPGLGGAIALSNAVLRASATRFQYNSALGGDREYNTDNGSQKAGPAMGGAVYALRSALDFEDCQWVGNQAQVGANPFSKVGMNAQGGALHAQGCAVRMHHCVLEGNRVNGGTNFGNTDGSAYGGAVSALESLVHLTACEFRANIVQDTQEIGRHAYGAGVYLDAGTWSRVRECLFADNIAKGGDGFYLRKIPGHAQGAGVWNAGSLEALSCTFDGNQALGGGSGGGTVHTEGAGGGLWNQGRLLLENCTFHGNLAAGGEGSGVYFEKSSGIGGGLANQGGQIDARNCSWVANTARWSSQIQRAWAPIAVRHGGGLYNGGGPVTLANCLFNHNEGEGNVWGAVQDLGHNLSSDGTGMNHASSLANTDALTGPLVDLGGQVPVVPLLAGSPALDAADALHLPATDARGVARPQGSAGDIGAYEASPGSVLLGRISIPVAYSPTAMVVRVDGAQATWLDAQWFRIAPTNAGVHVITPSHPDWVFVPPSRTVSLPQIPGNLEFAAHRRHSLELVPPSLGGAGITFFGTPGQQVELMATPSLVPASWTSLGTHRADDSGILLLPLDPSQPTRVYRFDLIPEP